MTYRERLEQVYEEAMARRGFSGAVAFGAAVALDDRDRLEAVYRRVMGIKGGDGRVMDLALALEVAKALQGMGEPLEVSPDGSFIIP